MTLPPGVQVRPARPEEYDAAGAVTQAAWLEFARPDDPLWRGYFDFLGDARRRAERAAVLVAVVGGEVVGTATVELDATIEGDDVLEPGHANFRMLAVAPEWRGKGVGRRLVEACLELARASGKRRATLHTTDEMTVATGIYRSLGFVRDPAADRTLSPELTLRAYRLDLG